MNQRYLSDSEFAELKFGLERLKLSGLLTEFEKAFCFRDISLPVTTISALEQATQKSPSIEICQEFWKKFQNFEFLLLNHNSRLKDEISNYIENCLEEHGDKTLLLYHRYIGLDSKKLQNFCASMPKLKRFLSRPSSSICTTIANQIKSSGKQINKLLIIFEEKINQKFDRKEADKFFKNFYELSKSVYYDYFFYGMNDIKKFIQRENTLEEDNQTLNILITDLEGLSKFFDSTENSKPGYLVESMQVDEIFYIADTSKRTRFYKDNEHSLFSNESYKKLLLLKANFSKHHSCQQNNFNIIISDRTKYNFIEKQLSIFEEVEILILKYNWMNVQSLLNLADRLSDSIDVHVESLTIAPESSTPVSSTSNFTVESDQDSFHSCVEIPKLTDQDTPKIEAIFPIRTQESTTSVSIYSQSSDGIEILPAVRLEHHKLNLPETQNVQNVNANINLSRNSSPENILPASVKKVDLLIKNLLEDKNPGQAQNINAIFIDKGSEFINLQKSLLKVCSKGQSQNFNIIPESLQVDKKVDLENYLPEVFKNSTRTCNSFSSSKKFKFYVYPMKFNGSFIKDFLIKQLPDQKEKFDLAILTKSPIEMPEDYPEPIKIFYKPTDENLDYEVHVDMIFSKRDSIVKPYETFLDQKSFKIAKNYQKFIFENCLYKLNTVDNFKTVFDENNDINYENCQYLILPISYAENDRTVNLDFNHCQECADSKVSFSSPRKIVENDYLSNYETTIFRKTYGNMNQLNELYFKNRSGKIQTADSTITRTGENSQTFIEYFSNNYKEIRTKLTENSKILPFRIITQVWPSFRPRVITEKSSKTSKNSENWSKNADLPIEYLEVVHENLSFEMIMKFRLVPFIIDKLYNICKAEEAFRKIKFELKLDDAQNQKRQHQNQSKSKSSIDCLKLYDYYYNPKNFIKCLTTAGREDLYDNESLETLGDAFLKFTYGFHLFKTYCCVSGVLGRTKTNEGTLTLLKSFNVSNENLVILNENCKFNLKFYLISMKFVISKKNKLPSVYPFWYGVQRQDQQVFLNKRVADGVESMIGYLLLDFGFIAAKRYINYLGLGVSEVFSKVHIESETVARNTRICNLSNFIENLQLKYVNKKFTDAGIQRLENKLDYNFKNRNLVILAFTHASVNSIENYQTLEFLGDSILDFLITFEIYKLCEKDNMQCTPGHLTNFRSSLVSNSTLAKISVELQLHKILVNKENIFSNLDLDLRNSIESFSKNYASGQKVQGWNFTLASEAPKILGDIFEALVGAIFIDVYDRTVDSKSMSNDEVTLTSLQNTWKIIYPFLKNRIESFQHYPPLDATKIFEEQFKKYYESKEWKDSGFIAGIEEKQKGNKNNCTTIKKFTSRTRKNKDSAKEDVHEQIIQHHLLKNIENLSKNKDSRFQEIFGKIYKNLRIQWSPQFNQF